MECPLCESGTHCEVHDADQPRLKYRELEPIKTPYTDGMKITVETYLNRVEILLPAELCRTGSIEVARLAEALVDLCLNDYMEKEAPDDEPA